MRYSTTQSTQSAETRLTVNFGMTLVAEMPNELNPKAWQEVAAEKKRQQTEALEKYAGGTAFGFDSANNDITAIPDASVLLAKMASRQVTAEAVITAYIHKAYQAHEHTNCLTEVLFSDALQRAKELDQYMLQHGSPIGPLHGLPVTLKDQFNVKGWDSTLGYVGRAFEPAQDDAALVKMLRTLGAVVVAKTNLPQSIMWCETDNNVFGLTVNPADKNYTPGGSTGGESALLSSHGTILGWGTDIGGSIRIPSHMMGLYGLKPSSARLPYRGVPVSTEGQEHVPSSVGPLARSLDTIHVSMKALINLKPWEKDPRCVPIPWRESMYQEVLRRPLVFGVLMNDGVVQPHPPVTRVLQSAIKHLTLAGHQIVEWDAALHADCIAVQDSFYSVDGGEDIRRDVSRGGEPFIPHVKKLVERGPAVSVYDYWQLNRKKHKLQEAYLDKWNSIRCPDTGQPVDAILMPPMPHTAVPHKACGWVGYTKIWNFLDYPALIVPGGSAIEEDLRCGWTVGKMGNVSDTANGNIWMENRERIVQLGLPVGIQIICRKLEEEKVLGIGKVVDEILRETE